MLHFWSKPTKILLLILLALIFFNLWSIYLIFREMQVARKAKDVPYILRAYISQEAFESMRAYKVHRCCFIMVRMFVAETICVYLELIFGFYAFLWQVASKCAFARWMQSEILISIIFVILVTIYGTLKALPFDLYEKFCIKDPRKLRKRAMRSLIFSQLVNIIFLLLLTCIVVSFVVLLGQMLGVYLFIALFCCTVLLITLLVLLLPALIDPVLGNFIPLANEPLRQALEHLTQLVGFPMKQVRILKSHDPNAGSNAFFFGCCCLKRIIIYDSLLLNKGEQDISKILADDVGKGLPNSQVAAVVCHELGHWMHGHFYKSILLYQIHLLFTFLLFGLCYPIGAIYQAVGFEEGLQPIIVGVLIIFWFVLTPYLAIANFVLQSATRLWEYQADRTAYGLGYSQDLKNSLMKLYADNMSFPLSDWLYSCWNHSHPTLLQRIERLEYLEKTSASG